MMVKINWASIGNSALLISGAVSAYLISINQLAASGVVVLSGIIAKAICSEIDNQINGATTPAPTPKTP
jgi:hypothetical protein